MEHELNISYAEYYGIPVDDYAGIPTTSLPFSVRVVNRFMSNSLTTLPDILKATPEQLMAIKGFGKGCMDEVSAYCASLRTTAASAIKQAASENKASSRLKQHTDEIALGDFSFAAEQDWSEDELEYIERLKEAYEVIGEEGVFDCYSAPEKVMPVIQMLIDFQAEMKPYAEIQELLRCVPLQRRQKKAVWYIKAFTIKDEERQALQQFCATTDSTITEMASKVSPKDVSAFVLAKQFLKWCTFDLTAEINTLMERIYVNDRARTVIQLRAGGATLESAGSVLQVTRERVRQIEMKVKRIFSSLHSRVRVVSKIAAERNGDTVLTPTEITKYCEEHATELLYLLQSYEGTNYTYDKHLDVFVIGDDSLVSRVENYLESLPNIVSLDQFSQFSTSATEDEDIPREMFEKAFLESYRRTGDVYHRSRLSLATIYQDIVSKYFPDGMHVYDSEEIAMFRDYVRADYGDVRLPENDRALTARIAGVCILCDRGKYRVKQKQYMPKALSEKIYKHIVNSDSPVFLTGSLHSIFEDELLAAGIDNRYYLQGVLHEIFADKLTFRRDYVSKDSSITSVYTAIIEFIKKSRYPVSKLQIQKAFPGITDIVITLSVGDPEILNYFGEYLHASRLIISDAEQQYLYSVVKQTVSDGAAHHAKDLHEVIIAEKPEVLTRNASMYPFGTYSILEYLFRNDFQFSRPYIALPGVEIGRPGERLRELINSSDSVAIADIRDFAKENRFQIQSMIDFAIAYNDNYLLADRDTLMRIDKIGITTDLAYEIEERVAKVVYQTMPIQQLDIWNELPRLNVNWNDWLLYSILKKWGTRVDVATSSNQMRLSVEILLLLLTAKDTI